MDDAFYRELYEDVQSQYHLDQLSSQGGAMSIGKADLGPFPGLRWRFWHLSPVPGC